MSEIKVSVIVPCYKVEKYLDRCMNSLLNQTLKEIEIILVDDGSPDNCPKMCDDYARQDGRVKVIHKENGGLGFARNSGLEVATGDYVAFCDSDDFVEKAMYEVLYDEAIKAGADVVFCNFYTETKKGTWKVNREVNERRVWKGKEIEEFMLDMVASAPYDKQERKYQMSVWHSIYQRNLIQKKQIIFPSERLVGSEDLPFQVDFLKCAKLVLYLPSPYYHYCNNASSLTSKYKPDMFRRYILLYEMLATKLEDNILYQQRLDRFFIGYSRYCITQLSLRTDINDRKKLLHDLLNDHIWIMIGNRYKPQYLPLYSKVFYLLTLNRNVLALQLFCWFSSYIKEL